MLKSIFACLLVLVIFTDSYAAVSEIQNSSCTIYNDVKSDEGDKKVDDGKKDEEEPECE